MRRFYSLIIVVLLVTFFVSCAATKQTRSQKKDISPFEYGLVSAKTGVERYQAVLKAHTAALEAGVNVDYTGIDTIRVELPSKAVQIPLTSDNDFKGCVFIIKNKAKHIYLFKFVQESETIDIDKKIIDDGDFKNIKELKRNRSLLLVEDEKPWVQNREGYAYGHKRKDMMLIEEGIAQKKKVMQ